MRLSRREWLSAAGATLLGAAGLGGRTAFGEDAGAKRGGRHRDHGPPRDAHRPG